MKKLFVKLYDAYYWRIFPSYRRILTEELKGCNTILDVGCGNDSPIQYFSRGRYLVGIDMFSPSLKASRLKKIHNKYYKMNALDIAKKFRNNSFDCVIASDLIEHLSKKDGIKLIKAMKKIARKRVIILTPNGFMPQDEYDNNIFQIHKSGWRANEMRRYGFEVKGLFGLKSMRDKYYVFTGVSRYLFLVLSDLTQVFLRNASKSAHIVCIFRKSL